MVLATFKMVFNERLPADIKFLFAADMFNDIILVLKYKWLLRMPGRGFNHHQF